MPGYAYYNPLQLTGSNNMSNELTPKDLYDAYPASDLLGIEPPKDGEAADDFTARVEAAGGDTLFLFLARELLSSEHDEVTLVEADARMERAKRDIQAIQDRIAEKQHAASLTT